MADKTTTLKTKTNDNVYPNVIGDNRDNAIVNSAHIKHTLTKDHKINFRLDDNVSNLIFNSLQKPSGLTKTELVGVGANGQENIEIGDNLTLANGKLSATGGGSGGDFEEITISNDFSSFSGTITGTKPVLINKGEGKGLFSQVLIAGTGSMFFYIDITDRNILLYQILVANGQIYKDVYKIMTKPYSHFITLTSSTSTFYFNYQNTSEDKLNTLDSLKTALAGKYFLCTGHTDSDTAEYISGENGNIVVGVVDNSDHSTSGITIDSSYTISDNVSPVE